MVGAIARRTRLRPWLASLLLLAVAVPCSATPASCEDSDRFRLYFGVREGESNPITKANDVASVSIGANLGRYFGLEFSVDGYELFLETPSQGKVGELGVLGLLPQVRLRYPLLEDRLTPYSLAGAGLAVAQINDGTVPISWTSGSLTSLRPMGAVGAGIEYYISDDIALGVEGKYLITGSNTYDADGNEQDVDMNVGVLTFGMRLFYPELHPDETEFAASHAARRFYLNVRFGGALRMAGYVFPDVGTEPEQKLFGSNFAPLFAVAVGAQLCSWADLELAGSNYELRLLLPDGGTTEYAVFPIVLQTRLHYRLPDARLDPYVVGGVGAEFTEVNDKSNPDQVLEGSTPAVVGTLGAGIDYFVTRNVAFGLETKYTWSRGQTLRIDDGPQLRGDLDSLSISLGVRAYLFDF